MTELLAAPAGVTIRRLAGNIGAEVIGVDAASPTDEGIAAVRQALLEHKVIFLRDQELAVQGLAGRPRAGRPPKEGRRSKEGHRLAPAHRSRAGWS